MTNNNEIIETINGVTYKVRVSKLGYSMVHEVEGGWRSVAQNARRVRLMVEAKMAKRIADIMYAYSDRRNGWYCFARDTEGNQVGDAVYLFTKREIIEHARDWAKAYSVKIIRG